MVTVMMPVYNAERFLREAIESILNQTERDFEFIIINDGSTDGSDAIIRSYSDPRIRYVVQHNQGEAMSRNNALDIARGEWILFQDADDISLPIRIEVLKRQAIATNAGFAHSDMLIVNERSQPVGYWGSSQVPRERVLRQYLRIDSPYNNPSSLVRREAFEGLRYDPSVRPYGTDSDLMIRIALRWPTAHVPEPLYLYRRHSEQMSTARSEAHLERWLSNFLERFSIEELVPEMEYVVASQTDRLSVGHAIVAVFLLRKGFSNAANTQYERSKELARDPDIQSTIQGIGFIAMRQFGNAIECFGRVSNQNAVVENYLGEAYLALGDVNAAYTQFQRALALAPQYYEPIENVKNIGRVVMSRR